jgi:hypothetical protein
LILTRKSFYRSKLEVHEWATDEAQDESIKH